MAEKLEIITDIAKTIQDALDNNQIEQAVEMLKDLHYADQADVFDWLTDDQRELLLKHLDLPTTAGILEELEDSDVLELLEDLPAGQIADLLDEMEPDEAADLLGDLPPNIASDVLTQMEWAEDVKPLLGYEDETAGGLMTTSYIALRRLSTAQQAIQFLREVSPDADVPYYLYVINQQGHLIGVVGLRELVISAPDAVIQDIMNKEVLFVRAGTDQEEVARIMSRYDLAMIPVVNEEHVLVGVITHDDILDVIEHEATEDVYRMAAVSDAELEPDSPPGQQLRGRLPWLFVNTFTAGFAAWVVSLHEATIAEVAALAVFQSVIAGQGGNSGSQNVAMIVRAMAVGNMRPEDTWGILLRQILVGLFQGLAVGTVVGLAAYIWRGNTYFGIVVAIAMIGNMLLAGIAGTVIPVLLKILRQDPALASTVLVTAVTDAGGFFIFFSLAEYFLEYLN